MDNDLNCHCSCGTTRFKVSGEPLLRAFCHCTICQAFNQAPYADITLFHTKDVLAPPEESVEFKAYRFPPILQRGRCVSCGRPAIEYLKIFPMPRIALVPSANIDDKELVPEPSIHIFYGTRVADIQDELPKYSGYLKSQFAIGHRVMASLLRRSIHS
jgi:hypothetical protein